MIGRGLAGVAALGLMAAGCGGGGGSPAPPTIAPAKEYRLDWQGPTAVAEPGRTTLRFAVLTPDGKVLKRFRTGAGPHTGVHLIIVRDDLSSIVHKHPPIPASGRLSLPVDLPKAGRYHVLVDVYPAAGALRNFQLTHELQVGTGNVKAALPAYAPVVHAGGLTFRVARLPGLRLAEPASMIVNVTDAAGKPITFTPFYGALAHAIFFRVGSLDYFHSHICGNDPACTSGFGTPATTGHSTKPGRMELGVLLPATGTWRLFLQVFHAGKLITAPFTLRVR
ncbi:MAG: hypothetical protein M3Q31_21730 [Actinomycetota bacterium]|nr:hypothetical protein [Actinomycetota bacterium]